MRFDTPFARAERSYYALVGIFTLLALVSIVQAQAVLQPIVIAVLLSLLCSRPLAVLCNAGLPRPVSAAGIVFSIIALLIGGVSLLSTAAARWTEQVPRMVQELERALNAFGRLDLVQAMERIQRFSGAQHQESIKEVFKDFSVFSTVVSGGPVVLSAILITTLLWYYFLAYGAELIEEASVFFRRYVQFEGLPAIAKRTQDAVSRYLFTITLINTALALALSFVLALLGMPNPIFWGVLGGLLNFVPYLGIVLGTLVVGLVALFTFEQSSMAVIVPLSYYIVSAVEGNIVTPTVLGGSFKLNPALVLVWLLVWMWMWGSVGALIAFPLLASTRIAWQEVNKARAEALLGANPRAQDPSGLTKAEAEAPELILQASH